jgi:hypothetical protein
MMNKALWVVGWWLYIAGWVAIVVRPTQFGLALWKGDVTPSAVELVPLITIVVIGILFVFAGKYLRGRFAA